MYYYCVYGIYYIYSHVVDLSPLVSGCQSLSCSFSHVIKTNRGLFEKEALCVNFDPIPLRTIGPPLNSEQRLSHSNITHTHKAFELILLSLSTLRLSYTWEC